MKRSGFLAAAFAITVISCSASSRQPDFVKPASATLPDNLWHATTLLQHRFVTFRYCEPPTCWTQSYLEWLGVNDDASIRVPIAELQSEFVIEAQWDRGPNGQILIAVVNPLNEVIDPMEYVYATVKPIEPGTYQYSVVSPSPWESGQLRQYIGTYRSGFELNEFVPDEIDQSWWLSGDLPEMPRSDSSPSRVAVRGILSRPGGWGHLGSYDRELKVVSMQVLNGDVVAPTKGAQPNKAMPPDAASPRR